eukprot:TRINITY_DN13869_c0_g1_i1.p1 TRINITY_DN13869_c0_g1~~TRINITY_DN13869_c0_g1_i1.p1  ORF type:complete len:767 (+),score=288.07 TRINITY_DN13869_c0_g1_i1:109-2301(+)
MSARLAKRFQDCRKAKRTAFVGFVTAGYPDKSATVDAMLTLEREGADVIELGVPFSDPTADGSVIQEASMVALKHRTTLDDCLSYCQQARAKGLQVPVVLMGYYNNFLQAGIRTLCERCKAAGLDGFIIVDLPFEEARQGGLLEAAAECDLSLVPLVAPTSNVKRVKELVQCALHPIPGFVYVVSLLGVTGVRDAKNEQAAIKEQRLRECREVVAGVKAAVIEAGANPADLPVVVGFGISQREDVLGFGQFADGAVVGSRIVEALGKGGAAAAGAVVRELSGGPLAPDAVGGAAPPAKRARVSAAGAAGEDWCFSGTEFGGRFIPETLMVAHEELAAAWTKWKDDPGFKAELARLRKNYIGGPTPLYHAQRLSEKCGGAQIWFKREELAHTGAHKINNAVGQALLAMKLGKRRIIAETGAGQHGVATASACALLGLDCTVYMGAVDCERQQLNVFRMKELGATVIPARSGSRTLKDAINEALRDWVTNIRSTHYIIGSAVGPHPFPDIVRDLQSVIGNEARAQMLNQTTGEHGHPTFTDGPGRLPDAVVACVGGGSNAIGMFTAFLPDKAVRIVGVEAGGEHGPKLPDGSDTDKHSATLTLGTVGTLHGARTYLLQTADGQIKETHSISAGLDYPGVGPQHAALKKTGRVEYVYATDSQALDAMRTLSRSEGIVPALEPSHALHVTMEMARSMPKDKIVLMNLCGRGDKDMLHVAKARGVTIDTDVRLNK